MYVREARQVFQEDTENQKVAGNVTENKGNVTDSSDEGEDVLDDITKKLGGIPKAALIGGAAGVVVLILLCIICCCRRKRFVLIT